LLQFSNVALLLSATSGASAAEIKVVPPSAVGRLPLIMVIGDIDSEDGEDFVRKASSLDNALVVFNSDGGSLFSGINIGETIHRKKFKTVVTEDSKFASASAFAWLGGSERFMTRGARIGFHAAYDADTGRETGVGNAVLGAYLSKIGLSYDAIIYITKAAPSEMTWLTPGEAARHGIAISESKAEPEAKRQASPDVPKSTQWRSNGSIMSLIADGAERRIIFSLPRAGFEEFGVRSGTLWFEGQQAGRTYRGYAYRFFKACGAIRAGSAFLHRALSRISA
jgi:ATP-dependent protease ClpP protease subunit